MFTQCAHCLTLFRITPEQLKAAAGQVRCCQCNQTFNALENLHESPMPFTTQPEGLPPTDGELTAEDKLIYYPPQQDEHSSLLINDSEVERSLDDLADDSTPVPSLTDDSNLDSDEQSLLKESSQFLYEQDDGLETEPDYYASGTESQMSELLDKDSASLLLDSEKPAPNLAEIIELDIPELETEHPPGHVEGLQSPSLEESKPLLHSDNELQPSDTDDAVTGDSLTPEEEAELEKSLPFTFEEEKQQSPSSPRSPLWTVGSLLLLIPLIGQMTWQLRDSLIHHDVGRQLLNTVCTVAGCTPPQRIDREKILITDRSLAAHPDKDNTLAMRLEVVNTAPFKQPYPKLQLSLFNEMGALVARRTFSESEYLERVSDIEQLMPKLQPIEIELELVDPGSQVTGFTFDFL
ncbi:MAG: zinc-ribbon and DUF3426 domain-containing protein [Candidatus Thiodiazotropha lotti]|nr:zinc-ribbon and DUF3426 domain-containing protein [Candidatus Thiodiazotropha lotti]MCW4195854.1 zinc-ribbon and DUF3426 domain-containing protein [Candidatus Thiodiazotropha lotti]